MPTANGTSAERKVVECIVAGAHGRSTASRIRVELGILNVHHASLFPDADGIAQFINHELPSF
jgi:hypothetical protein